MSEPLGISGRAFATFPECELAPEWRFQTIFPTYHESNMATVKPEMFWNQYKLSLLVLQLKIKCQRLPPHFDYVRQRRHCPTSDDIRNPKIRPRKPEVEMTLGLFPLPISWPTFWVSDVGRCYIWECRDNRWNRIASSLRSKSFPLCCLGKSSHVHV